MMSTSANEVAAWMLEELRAFDGLNQDAAVGDIIERFGESFAWYNDNGNSAIDQEVLEAFARLTGDAVVWSRGQRLWRLREQEDEPGRQQS